MSIYQGGISKDTSICNGDTAGIKIGIPSVAGITYAWTGENISDTSIAQPIVKPTHSKWYYVTLTDTTIRYSCQNRTDSVYVEVRNCCDTVAFALAGAGRDSSFCREDTTVIGVPIGGSVSGISYTWQQAPGIGDVHSPTQTVLPDNSRWYVVTIADSNSYCGSKTDSVYVQVKSCCDTLLQPQVSAGRDTVYCKDSLHGALIGTPPTAGIAYFWLPSVGLSNSSIAQPVAKPDTDTYYILSATDTSRRNLVCPAKMDTVFVMVEKCDTTGVGEATLQDVKVYPNPATGIFYFKGIESACRIDVYNMLGEVIHSSVANGDNYAIDISGNAKGMYFYRVANKAGTVGQGKIVLE